MKKKITGAFFLGIPIGTLGGLIGLGGAEFRLPVIKGIFKYTIRKAIFINLIISLITVITALFIRFQYISMQDIMAISTVIITLMVGAISGAYSSALLSHKISEKMLEWVIFILLVLIGFLLITEAFIPLIPTNDLNYSLSQILALGIPLGFIIGVVSSLLGVAGGELIIPTLILVFGVDIKIAGSASLIISIPTIITGLIRHLRSGASVTIEDRNGLIIPMGMGSIIGAWIGGLLIYYISGDLLKAILGLILIISSIKILKKIK